MKGFNQGKTALVLAGGGLTGAVYEIGALRAIDDLLIDRCVNDFDIFIGTSAGALVSALLANGMTPEEMIQVITGNHPEAVTFDRKHIFGMGWQNAADWGVKLPVKLVKSWTTNILKIDELTLFDFLWNLSESLPAGLYDNLTLSKYLNETLSDLGYSDQFSELHHKLYIIATDLDTGERAIFGPDQQGNVPISLAVAASSALPIIYKPIKIGDHEYVDGGLRGPASLDLAVEQGATMIVCINPLVPIDYHLQENQTRRRLYHLSERGIQSIANQSMRIFSHSSLHYHIKQLRKTHPDVDIILIEPKSEDFQMLPKNIMQFSSRMAVAQHGFQSVTLDLAEDYATLKASLARHGIPISRRLVIEELMEISHSNSDPEIIQRIMEARRPGCKTAKSDSPFCQLTRTLAELELTLDQISEN